jgi:wyosine [tRNA(Phe)-imidazoG37] synthetase (radical SAM superfamily)
MTKSQPASAIYGPVRSWRLGLSLGVDVLLVNSICSFRCIYCQLGKINVHTRERRVFVPTERVLEDLRKSDWRTADAIAFSGSGEPTLAANLGEVIDGVQEIAAKPVVVLTNSTLLDDPNVRRELAAADQVCAKLDAADERTFRQINRPVAGLTWRGVVEGLRQFRREYRGRLAVQVMLQPRHLSQTADWAAVLREIQPDEVQLNLPTRPVPRAWQLAARGNYARAPYEAALLKVVQTGPAQQFAAELKELAGLRVLTK